MRGETPEDSSVLGCYAMFSGKSVLTFQRTIKL